jgi:hypothetical protein
MCYKKNSGASLLLTGPLENGFKGELRVEATTVWPEITSKSFVEILCGACVGDRVDMFLPAVRSVWVRKELTHLPSSSAWGVCLLSHLLLVPSPKLSTGIATKRKHYRPQSPRVLLPVEETWLTCFLWRVLHTNLIKSVIVECLRSSLGVPGWSISRAIRGCGQGSR